MQRNQLIGGIMSIEKVRHLACVKYADGKTRINLADENLTKVHVKGDDCFIVDIPFSEENSCVLCKLIAKCLGMRAVDAGRGMRDSFLFDLV